MNVEKWKKAVVQLECVVDSEEMIIRRKLESELLVQVSKGEITNEDYGLALLAAPVVKKDIRTAGTAVFFIRNDKRYLLTAKHVVVDEISGARIIKDAEQQVLEAVAKEVQRPDTDSEEDAIKKMSGWISATLAFAKERAEKNVYTKIFRVSSFDEYLNDQVTPYAPSIVGAWSVGSSMSEIVLSEGHDLAVISLDVRYRSFADNLISLGYAPITDDDLNTQSVFEGEEVFTVGFPKVTSSLGEMVDLHPYHRMNGSSRFAVPVTSFGRIALYHSELPYLLANMSVYPGNSGGPAVVNDKLVGLVSRHIVASIERSIPAVEAEVAIPFTTIIPSRFLMKLIRFQEVMDEFTTAKEYLNPHNKIWGKSSLDDILEGLEDWAANR